MKELIGRQTLFIVTLLFLSLGLSLYSFSSDKEDLDLLIFNFPVVGYTEEQIQSPVAQDAIKNILPHATRAWGTPELSSGFLLFAGTTPMNRGTILSNTREETRSQLRDFAKNLEEQMNLAEGFKATYRLREVGSIFVIEGEVFHQPSRLAMSEYKYFYNPDYRLDVLIRMNESAKPEFWPVVNTGLASLEKKLVAKYPKGIRFKGE
ncbi:MAG: hypothetical protein ABID83_01260 [Candidatus Omnitrophota bacterium]